MSTISIHRAYNDVVASHYDLDPQGVIGRSLDSAIGQLQKEDFLSPARESLSVLDIGMGTGLFLGKLRTSPAVTSRRMGSILPKTWSKTLAEDSRTWSLRLETPPSWTLTFRASNSTAFAPILSRAMCQCGYSRQDRPPAQGGRILVVSRRDQGGVPRPASQGDSQLIRWLSGAGSRQVDDTVLNPADLHEVVDTMEAHGLEVREGETFKPTLEFRDFDQFMEFGYRGGWLTPLIESLGVHRAGPAKRWLLNRLVFPLMDSHNIVIALGRKHIGRGTIPRSPILSPENKIVEADRHFIDQQNNVKCGPGGNCLLNSVMSAATVQILWFHPGSCRRPEQGR